MMGHRGVVMAVMLLAAPTAWAAPVGSDEAPHLTEAETRVRHLTLAGSIGFQNMVPLGVFVGLNVQPKLTVDVGLGYSPVRKGRIGARVRYQLLQAPISPFVGVGGHINPADGRFPALNFGPGGGGDGPTFLHSGCFITPIAGAVMHGPTGAFGLLGLGYSFRVTGGADEGYRGVAFEAAGGYSF